MKKILVTGAAGFIGFHYAQKLCVAGYDVIGLDNLNDYYDVNLKQARLDQLKPFKNFRFQKMDIADAAAINKIFAQEKFDIVAHMAAQAGVRYSMQNPKAYADSNLTGFLNILEASRHNTIKHLIFACSSSVYGANKKIPFSVSDTVDHPISFYAATKKANEAMAHSYAHLHKIPVTGLRFFTVYGPWGRPDMAVYGFTRAIDTGRPIDVYNNGDMKRDFTYVDDIVESMMRLIDKTPAPDPVSGAPYKIYNIGNNHPEKLMDMISYIESALGKDAVKVMKPMQPGDVYETFADITDLANDTGFRPATPLKSGIEKFVTWYKDYYTI
jgi:UDP-glucuronate 4-epimerase